VGRRFPGIEWKVIRITDGPLKSIEEVRELPVGEIGELIVRGPVVTSEYVTRTDCNPLHKIVDGDGFWHRMGDVGYLEDHPSGDPQLQRFWFCGRKAHRVTTSAGTRFTIPCEAIFNQHAKIYRSALVGVGPAGQQRPVLIAEPWPEHWPATADGRNQLVEELQSLAAQHAHTAEIRDIFLMRHLPVDIRHNAKIFREKLAVWAEKELSR
jgi:acyl-CoA synthetase (AMP-forming)/AMP-acid ligase II